jgi:hypothetical protein
MRNMGRGHYLSDLNPISLTLFKDKWVEYKFNFFNSNQIELGSDQSDMI